MIALRTLLTSVGVFLWLASAAAQTTDAEVRAAVALFSKGRPASMSVDDWELDRIGFFSRLRDLATVDHDLQTPRVAIPLLLSTLNDASPEVAVSAAGALLVVDPASRARAIAALAAGLNSGSDQAEQWAIASLVGRDRIAEDIESILTTYVRQRSSMNRPQAVRALSGVLTRRIAAVTPVLVPLLSDRDPATRQAAATTLGQFGPRASSALSALVAARERAGDWERPTIDEAIASITDPPSPTAVPAGLIVTTPTSLPAALLPSLQSQLRAPAATTRLEALRTISGHRGGAESLAPALTTLLKDPDHSVRYRAAYVLTSVDRGQAAPALPVLAELLFSKAPVDGGYIGEVLASSGLARLGEPGAAVLISALTHADLSIRQSAITGLAASDAFPAAAVGELLRLLDDPDETSRLMAMATLSFRRVPAAQVAGPLSALLKDGSEGVRQQAIAALAMLGPDASEALPMIKAQLSSTNDDVKFVAAVAIVAIEGTRRDLPTVLDRFATASAVGSVESEAASDMRLASFAFIRLGREAASAAPALTRAWEREAEPTRTYVGAALAAVDPTSAARVVDAMIETARQDGDYLAIEALYSLAALGPIASSAESALASFTTHANAQVRIAARAALAAIRVK